MTILTENMMNLLEALDFALKYLIVPAGGWVILQFGRLNSRVTSQEVEIAVLKANETSNARAHEREMGEVRGLVQAIFAKLDSIEATLRK